MRRWLADPVSDRDWDNAHLVNVMLDIHADDPEFGYRFIVDELGRLGWDVGENRVPSGSRRVHCQPDVSTEPRSRPSGWMCATRRSMPWVASHVHIVVVASLAILCRCQGTPVSQAIAARSPVMVACTYPTARSSSRKPPWGPASRHIAS